MWAINVVWKQATPKGSNLPSCPPTPYCEELTLPAGPECTSYRGPKIIGVQGSRTRSQLLHFKHLDTRLHSSVTKRNYTWQFAYRHGGRCVSSQHSVKNNAVSVKMSKSLLVNPPTNSVITKSVPMNRKEWLWYLKGFKLQMTISDSSPEHCNQI